MTIKRLLLITAALACVAAGFIGAHHIDRMRYGARIEAIRAQHDQQLTESRAAAERWAHAIARGQGEAVLRAFAAGITPAVLAGRREGIEIAAVSLLQVPGIAGIHVLGLDGAVLYSSDAKLVATGEAEYRGAWALQVAELTARPSTRPGVIDIATPIANADKPLVTVWLEYDVDRVRDAHRPAEVKRASDLTSQVPAS